MPEKKGFLSRVFGGAKDADEVIDTTPEGRDFDPAHKDRDADENVALKETPDAPSPALHRPAAASTEADAEAGAEGDEPADGGITPLKEMEKKGSKSDFSAPSAPAVPGGAEGFVPGVELHALDSDGLAEGIAPATPQETRDDGASGSVAPSGGIARAADPAAETPAQSWLARMRSGLSRSSETLSGGVANIFRRRRLDEDTLEELEDLLIQADLGVGAASRVTDALRRDRYDEVGEEEVREIVAREIEAILAPVAEPLFVDVKKEPFVILMVGVNGTGKTTTIGKLAQKYAADDYSVMMAAGDTFRAAATDQLKIWGERTGAEVVARERGADAGALAFDAMKQAKDTRTELLLVDTAGRLQNREELMAELEKMIRVIRKHDETAPHAVLLTLDATTGQNALSQVEVFRERAGVTGLVMTKLDGTAKGGILVALADKHGLPVHYIGVGESADDLQPFDARDYARAIVGLAPA